MAQHDNSNTGALFPLTEGWLRGPFQVGATAGCTALRDVNGDVSITNPAGGLIAVAKLPQLPAEEGRPTKGRLLNTATGEVVRLVVFVATHEEHGTYYQIKVDKFSELVHPREAAKALAKL